MTESPAQLLLERLPLVTYSLRRAAPSPVVYVSPQVEAFFGYRPDQLEPDPEFLTRRIVEEDRPRFQEACERLRETGEQMVVEYRVAAADGELVWVRDTATADGDLIHGYLLDVTREKALETELARQRAALDAFFQESEIGLGITDAEGRYVKLNDALAAINGAPVEEHLGRTLAEVSPDVAAAVDPLRAAAGESRAAERIDIEVPGRDGARHMIVSYFPFSLGGERYHGRVVVDVTEERRAQAAEREYRRLLEALPLAAYTNDLVPERRARYVSPQIEELTGYPASRFVTDQGLGDRIIHPDDFATIDSLELEARGAGTSFEHVYRIVRADGEIRWVLDRMDTVFDDDGTAKYEHGFLVDITDRYEAQSMLRAIYEAHEAIVVADDRGLIVDANPAGCELAGLPREELLGRPTDEFVGGGSFTAYVEDGPLPEYTVLRRDGSTREIEVAARADVLPGRHIFVIRDVTERKRLERDLWRVQRLESVGRLAGGVAQDFNNLLTAIRGYAQLLQARVSPDSVEHHHATEIDRVADRAAALTAQLLALGRRQMLKARPLDLNRHLQSVQDTLVELAGPGIELVWERDPALHAVRADPSQIEQVLVNIVTNAVEAIEGEGRILVQTFNTEADGGDDLPPGRYAVLSISDDGCGIDEATLEHVFEPFFTTKEVGAGSGLGLASAYGIVRQSGGTITVTSVPGHGSTFSILLPEAGAGDAVGAAPGNGETVLVVERDPAVRDVLFELLTDARYRVLTAHTSVDALRLAETYDGTIDLVLADVDEPRRELLETTLQSRRPEVRAIALAKPYTPERLQRALREALASPVRVTAVPASG